MPNLGDLVAQGSVGSMAWAVRFVIRDVLRYLLERENLRREAEFKLLRLTSEHRKAIAGRKRRERRAKRK